MAQTQVHTLPESGGPSRKKVPAGCEKGVVDTDPQKRRVRVCCAGIVKTETREGDTEQKRGRKGGSGWAEEPEQDGGTIPGPQPAPPAVHHSFHSSCRQAPPHRLQQHGLPGGRDTPALTWRAPSCRAQTCRAPSDPNTPLVSKPASFQHFNTPTCVCVIQRTCPGHHVVIESLSCRRSV